MAEVIQNETKISPIAVDEIVSILVTVQFVASAEHDGQHAVLMPLQGGQASGETMAPYVQWNDGWQFLLNILQF